MEFLYNSKVTRGGITTRSSEVRDQFSSIVLFIFLKFTSSDYLWNLQTLLPSNATSMETVLAGCWTTLFQQGGHHSFTVQKLPYIP